ncbi:hypothetical protein Tco_0491224 [Tanacetum coccineum]
MGDEIPIRNIRDYSKPSHEGYRNTIELPKGNNVHDPSPRGRILLLVSLLNSFHQEGLQNSAMTSLCSNNIKESFFLKHGLNRGLRRRRPTKENKCKKAWATIKELARYEDEGWNDPVFPEEESLDYKNPNIEQLLGVMECKVDMLMKNAISLMGRSKDVCGMTSDIMPQLPPKTSRWEAFQDLVMNFIFDQEEKVKQLEEYMSVIGSDFMELSLEVIVKLKEEIRMEEDQKNHEVPRH